MTTLATFYAQHARLVDQIGVHALLAPSLSVSLPAGQRELAQAALAGIAAYVSAIASITYGWPLPARILVAMLSAALVAALLAYPIRRLRGVFLAIATIGFGEIVRVIANNLKITGGAEGISGIPNDARAPLIYSVLVVVGLLLFALSRTKFALAVALTREDENAARGVGIDVGMVRLASLALGGAIAGLAGALHAHAFFFIIPSDFGFGRMEQILVWCVIGGVTNPIGAVVGAALLSTLPEMIRGLQDFREVKRSDPARLILFAPAGIAGLGAPPGSPREPRLAGVGVRTAGARADDVSLAVEQGEILGLIGPNGAGKTTLINVLTGSTALESGTIELAGRRIDGLPVHRIARAGIARTYQNIRLFGALDVRTNLSAGAFAQPGRLSAADARSLLERVGIAHVPLDAPASALPYGDQRRLEIARALAARPTILMLDESAAGMNPAETSRLAETIRTIAREGAGVLLIEHDMTLVRAACDAVVVLNFGEVLARGTPAAVARDPAVIEAYLGTGVA